MTKFLDEQHIDYKIFDERPKLKKLKFTNNIQLLSHQEPIVTAALTHDNGVIVAPAGSGKTAMGLELIVQRKSPALILVHRKQLLDQWIDRIEQFLEIPKRDIGQYYSVKKQEGKGNITVAMMQTLARMSNVQELSEKFGTIIVDECHHVPANTFREIVSKFNPRYIYGLTATPKRKHNDEALVYLYIGEIIAKLENYTSVHEQPTQNYAAGKIPTEVLVRGTAITLPFKFTTDNYQLLAKIICFDTRRNQQIVTDLLEQIEQDKKVLLLSERRDHLEVLRLYLKGLCETIVISGEDSLTKRASKLKQIQSGHYQVILSTGQFFGEGLDISSIDSLVLAFPFSFEGKLVQYIGRLRSTTQKRIIIDYRDKDILFLERQFKQRMRVYKKSGYTIDLPK